MLKILVTGGSGFIGSALVRFAISLGHKVINIDSLTYASNSRNLLSIENDPNYSFEKVDIRNLEEIETCFKKNNPEVVVHLAAESHVDRSIEDPSNFITTNIVGRRLEYINHIEFIAKTKNSITFKIDPYLKKHVCTT